MTPSERLLGARIGGFVTVRRYGGPFMAARANAGLRAKFATDTEWREHMRSLGIRSAQKRRETALAANQPT